MLARCAYRFQLRPTEAQEARLLGMAGARRYVWNWALARRKAYYGEHGTGIPAKLLSSELTALKHTEGGAWLKGADSQLLQQALRDLDRAFSNFFERRAHYPRFKSRKRDEPRFRIPQRVRVEDGKVYVPKVGWVRLRQSMPVGSTKSATFKRDPEGKWWVTLTAEFDLPDRPLPPVNPDAVVGLDAGLKDFVVTSDGRREPNPRFYRRGQRKLRRAQRALSRRQKGSKGREKAKRRVARTHRRISDQRRDFLHKLSTSLVLAYDGLCIENLSVRGLARTKLALSMLDASHGEFRRQIEYKTLWHRKQLAVIDRFFPSSRLCGECRTVNADLVLSDRVWTCACGAVHDRDLNAARNIKTEGLKLMVAVGHADTRNAGGAHVSLPMGAVGVEARIPRL